MPRNKTLAGTARFLLAAAVLTLAATCTTKASQTINTPNIMTIFYALNPGTTTGNYGLAAYVPVQLMGTCITSGVRGVGHVSLLRIPSQFLEWVGQNSTGSAAGSTTHGFSGTAGTDIVAIDYANQVHVEVGSTADTFRVANSSGAARQGYLTLIW